MNEEHGAYCVTDSISAQERLKLPEPTREGCVKARLPAMLDKLGVAYEIPETFKINGDSVVLPGLPNDICVYCSYDNPTQQHLIIALKVYESSGGYDSICEWNEKERAV